MRKNRVSSANLSNLPALRHGLAKEDFQSERKTPVLSVQGGLVIEDNLLYLSIDFAPAIPLYFSEADFAETGLGIIHFFRDNQNQVNGFWLNTEHIHHLEFKKLHQPQHSYE